MKLMGKCFSHSELSDNGNVKDETNKKIENGENNPKLIEYVFCAKCHCEHVILINWCKPTTTSWNRYIVFMLLVDESESEGS